MDQKKPAPFLARLFVLLVGILIAAEMALQLHVDKALIVGRAIRPVLAEYLPIRAYVIANITWILPVGLVVVVLALVVLRWVIVWWRNVVVARLSGAALTIGHPGFPRRSFDLREQIAKTPAGHYFIGLDRRGKPVYLTEKDLDSQGHIMGHTGTGKTKSLLEPLIFQDMRAGKGAFFMDAKGSSENVQMMKAFAAITGRVSQLKVFALAFPEWSHTYNPVHIAPGAKPLEVAERVFSVFPLEHEYYRGQSRQLFANLVRLMAGTNMRFNLTDIRLAIADDEVLDHVKGMSEDTAAKYEIDKQLKQLGHKRLETFTGLYNALAEYDHPLLNAYDPDIVIEDIMNNKGLVYFNLPANLYPLLAPAIGKIVLQHVKAVGSLRQVDRKRFDQTPFSVSIDELNRFAFPELVPALNMLRDAHVQFRLSHQSLGDLEQVSPEFARQIKDNTRWKVSLFENDPDHIEQVCRSYGTHMAFKKTTRFSLGPLFTWLNTGESSNREVEEFNLHPNQLKALAPQGQGYLLLPDRTTGVSFEMLPRFDVGDYTLPRRPAGDGLNLYNTFVMRPCGSMPKNEVDTFTVGGLSCHARHNTARA